MGKYEKLLELYKAKKYKELILATIGVEREAICDKIAEEVSIAKETHMIENPDTITTDELAKIHKPLRPLLKHLRKKNIAEGKYTKAKKVGELGLLMYSGNVYKTAKVVKYDWKNQGREK